MEMKNSLMVWALSIEINALPKKNGQICPVGKDVRCNREMAGNALSIRGFQRHASRRDK